MSKNRSDVLFQLIKSMRTSEKRYFKTLNQRAGEAGTKYLKLFEALDKLENFEEEKLLARNTWIKPTQFSNLKAHLYQKILQSLKSYSIGSNEEIAIREKIDYIHLLFDRSLYGQSYQLLEKVKKSLIGSENLEVRLEVSRWEILLLPFTIGKNNQERVQQIVKEANEISERIARINLLTSLSVELNSIYLRRGYIRNHQDFEEIRSIFNSQMPNWPEESLSFRERLLWHEIQLGYFSHIQDLENTFLYAQKWVALFAKPPKSSFFFEMYLRGLNHLLNAQSRLGLKKEFAKTHKHLRLLANHHVVRLNENIQIRLFKYSYAHQFNMYFMFGDFEKGCQLLGKIESRLEGYIGMIDKHSELVLFYKIACLHFGNGDFRGALKWLNRIINSEDLDIREDVHSFARIINLITHYELGNRDVLEYAVRSTYRFLRKKDDLHHFQKEILDFIKNLSWSLTEKELIRRFKLLREKLLPISNSRFDRRAFVYFDIISWLESKIEQKSIEEIIKTKSKLAI